MPNIKSILVTGANGQLGRSLKAIISDYPQYAVTFANREMLDLSKPSSIDVFFKTNKFDLIINCAAYTAVDKAESEPKLADAINHLAVKQIAEIAVQQQAKLIHISTDYVFNGQQHRPYVETDKVDPQGVYGKTKLAGEQALQAIMPTNSLIIRTSWLYSEFGNSFVKTMLKLAEQKSEIKVIYDQVGTPTYAGDLAKAIMSVVQSNAFNKTTVETNVYHFSNEGVSSWYDFARTIFELSNMECNTKPIESKDYPTAAKRPHYSVLNKSKIKELYKVDVPYWKEALQCCLQRLKDNN